MARSRIAILTDFGEYDPFVSIMKGVIAQISPQISVVDISHQVPPGDIQRGAVVLWQAQRHFPSDTVFLTVVDPGVGTERKAIYLKARNQIFIGPDNGIFSYLLDDDARAWELKNPRFQYTAPSTTFHGRDIFAPAAAHAALGTSGSEFGGPVSDLVTLPPPLLDVEENALVGEVITEDHFGNLLTSLGTFTNPGEDPLHFQPWTGSLTSQEMPKDDIEFILPGGNQLPLISTFDDLEGEACGALVGSTGLIEVVANQRSAADLLGLSRGDRIRLQF